MNDQQSFANRFHFWFNGIMIVLYSVIGVLLLFILRFESLPSLNTKMIGGVLLLYASYRTYKLYKSNAVRKRVDQANANQ